MPTEKRTARALKGRGNPANETFTVRMTAEEREAMRKIAAEQNRSMADLLLTSAGIRAPRPGKMIAA